MAKLEFTIHNGVLTVGSANRTTNYYVTDFNIKSKGDEVIVYPKDGVGSAADVNRVWREKYSDITINTETPTSASDAVEKWNYVVMASIGFNTGYPQNLFAFHMIPDTSVPQRVVPIVGIGHAGYVTITTPSGNSGVVYVGDSGVASVPDYGYQMEADKSITLELADLGNIWVMNETSGDYISVIGAYKT